MTTSFGALLKQTRKRAGMTQDDLAAATGYSRTMIGAWEQNVRLPDLERLIQTVLPALGLPEEPHLAAQLIELAALARGERPPASLTLKRERQVVFTAEVVEERHRLPLPPTALLGRDPAVSHLCSRLLGHQGRLLTLIGPPGVGKTRLAQAVGAALQTIYPDGAIFVPLAAVNDPALVATSLVTALQIQDGSPKPPQTRLIEYLRRKELLLILDNFEQLISPPLLREGQGVGLLAALLAECAGLRLLVTSRERLHLRAEQRYRVPPLALPVAVELFAQRATAVDANFVLTAANRPTVEAICQRLDQLPLAIELCAAQIDLLAPPQLLAHLQAAPLDLLVAGAHDLPPQQRTLRHAIHHSYRLLNDAEQTLLRSLGVFAGGFALAEVEVVSGWSPAADAPSLLATLHALIGKSLVHTETLPTSEQRFWLLETIREFALEQAHLQGEEALLRQRHYDAYLQLFRTADSHLRGPENATWFARLQPEQDNLRAALQWALDGARYTDTAWLVLAANWFWEQHGLQSDAGRFLVQLLPHRHQLAPDLRLALWVILNAASLHLPAEFQALGRATDEVMGLLEECADNLLQSAVWSMIGDMERAIRLARAADEAPGLGVEFGLLADRTWILGTELLGYADHLLEHGEFARAATLARENVTLFQAHRNRYERVGGLGLLGRLALLQGDLEQAHQLLAEAVAIAVAVNYQEVVGGWQTLLGRVVLYLGDATKARRLLTENLKRCMELKLEHLLAWTWTYLAETALVEGALDEAEQWLAQSLAANAELRPITISALDRLWVAARLKTAQQQYQRAAMLFGLAEQMPSRLHHVVAGPIYALADAALTTVRAALGPVGFTEAFAAGQQMSLEEAFAILLPPT